MQLPSGRECRTEREGSTVVAPEVPYLIRCPLIGAFRIGHRLSDEA